jgi:perosamine synthetase
MSQKQRIVDIIRQETINGRPFGRYTQFLGGTITRHDLKIAARFLSGGGSLIDGPEIVQYEEAFADFLGVKYAVSFGAGRVAFHAILKAMGIGAGSDVLVLGYTCVVVPNAILSVGARPVYVDLDSKTLGIDPTTLESRITPQTRAIMVQHTLGIPTEMAPIMQLAKKYRLTVIEDCAHSIGSTYEGQMVGTLGDAAFFSGEPSKCISTGNGGMATTNDETLGQTLREFQQTCRFPDKTYIRKTLLQFIAAGTLLRFPLSGVGRVLYYGAKFLIGFPKSVSLQEQRGQWPNGLEARLSNAQAALGLSQLQQLPHSIAHRLKVAQIYEDELIRAGWPIVFPAKTAKTQVVFLHYPIWIGDNQTVHRRGRLELEIGNWFDSPVYFCNGGYLDVVCYQTGSCLVAEDMVRHIISLPTHSRVTPAAARATIREIIDRYAASTGL